MDTTNYFFLIVIVIGTYSKPHDQPPRSHEKVIIINISNIFQAIRDSEHFHDGVHIEEFDHAAFLGQDEAKRTESLPKEESLKMLGYVSKCFKLLSRELVDKMDVDHDGFISQEELKAWLKKIENRYVADDVDRTYDEYNDESKTGYITFDQHKHKLAEDYADDDDDESSGIYILK